MAASTLTEQQQANFRALMKRRAKLQLGLSDAALTSAMEETFDQLADLLRNDHSRPFDAVGVKELSDVRALVEQLPKTKEVELWLADTVDGPIHHQV
jgi:hypothetical protein